MPPLYKWFYVAEALAGVALIAHLLQASAYLSNPTVPTKQMGSVTGCACTFMFYQLPPAIAVSFVLMITWKYWGWLLTERKS